MRTEPPDAVTDISRLKILEIGDVNYFKMQYPDRTTMLWTGWQLHPGPETVDALATPGRVLRALREARDGRYDVVVVAPHAYGAWHPRYWVKGYFQTPLNPWAGLTRALGVSWLRLLDPKVPVIGLDIGDGFPLGPPGFFLLDRAVALFKRELPVDRWQVLTGTAHPRLPTLRYRKSPRWIARMDRLRPIPLAHHLPDSAAGPFEPVEKRSDLFFAGTVAGNSTVRADGLRELEALRARGVVVDVPERPLPFEEYRRRLAAAWLCWSPEGMGWDCYRHTEAALVHTVPVINYPTILRHKPMQDGVHAVFYPPEPGGLVAAVLRALEDRPRLTQMAAAAREHVLAHHTLRAVCDHMLNVAVGNPTD